MKQEFIIKEFQNDGSWKTLWRVVVPEEEKERLNYVYNLYHKIVDDKNKQATSRREHYCLNINRLDDNGEFDTVIE